MGADRGAQTENIHPNCHRFFVFALAAEIVAEIMRILMFANKAGLHRDIDTCIYGHDAMNQADVEKRRMIKRIARLEWWFYPFTTFVCGFSSFILHAFAIGMAGKVLRSISFYTT